MNQTSIHHADNVLTQINAFYWFHMTQKHFLSCHSRSKDKCHFYRLFSVNIRRTFLVNLTSIFHANNVFNQPNSFYGFTWNSWNIFFRVSRVLKCLWSPSIILHTLSWCYDAECDPLPSYSFLFHWTIDRTRSPFSMDRKAHCCKSIEQHLVDLFLARFERMFCRFQPVWR